MNIINKTFQQVIDDIKIKNLEYVGNLTEKYTSYYKEIFGEFWNILINEGITYNVGFDLPKYEFHDLYKSNYLKLSKNDRVLYFKIVHYDNNRDFSMDLTTLVVYTFSLTNKNCENILLQVDNRFLDFNNDLSYFSILIISIIYDILYDGWNN